MDAFIVEKPMLSSYHVDPNAKRSRMMWILVFGHLVDFMSLSALISTSLDFMKELGHGASMSGLLVSSGYFLFFFGTAGARLCMEPWSQTFGRNACVISCVWHSITCIVNALVMTPSAVTVVQSDVRFFVVMASCVSRGLLQGISVPLAKMMVLKVVPKFEYINFHSYWNASTTLGLGLGPALCSLLSFLCDIHTTGNQAAAPQAVLAVVFLVFALGTWWVIPSDIQDLIDIKSVQDAEPDEASQTTTAKEASSGTWVNKHVWVADAVLGQVRAGVVSSLEVASAMLMERFYELSTREIGLILGATFVAGWMSMELLRAVRRCGILTDSALVCVLAATSLLSTSLFFDWHVGWQESRWGFWLIVTADVSIFSTVYVANSIADGLCSAYAVPGTWYSQENALICNGLQNTVGRFAGPPVSRYLIDVGGQNAYALAQTFICTVPLSAGLVMWRAIRTGSLGPLE